MSDSVLFIGTYDIPPGGADSFYRQVAAMNQVVRDEEPRVVFIGHYVNEDESEGTSIHLHPGRRVVRLSHGHRYDGDQ